MTSQVALFNKLGVAVASDTVTTHFNGGSQKTTNNAEKIHLLGDAHKVVVLHSGSTETNWVHATNIIAAWAESLVSPLPTLEAYVSDFRAWINADRSLLHPESDDSVVRSHLHEHFEEVARRTQELISDEQERLSPGDALRQAVVDGHEWLSNLELFDGASELSDAEFANSQDQHFRDWLTHVFRGFEGLDLALPLMMESVPLVLSRTQNSDLMSVLGFVGFGTSDHFARTIRLKIRGRYNGLFRCSVDSEVGADNSSSGAGISVFAQADAIHGFLRGGQPSLMSTINYWVRQAVYQIVDGEDAHEIATRVGEDLSHHIRELQEEHFSDPILDTISGMSLLGLAELAESLVSMQATFSSAVSTGPATVGGFVEVLLISRSRGVQWIKRLPGMSLSAR